MKTKVLMSTLLVVFIAGFMLPLALMIYVKGRLRHILHYVAFITLCFFEYLEFAQIRYEGWAEYFSDGWNYVDSSQFLLYGSYLIMDIFASENYHTNSYQLTMNLMHMLVLV